jgi:hypothetical protein
MILFFVVITLPLSKDSIVAAAVPVQIHSSTAPWDKSPSHTNSIWERRKLFLFIRIFIIMLLWSFVSTRLLVRSMPSGTQGWYGRTHNQFDENRAYQNVS